jgi:molybdopterin/thiamine biosynthesis adenylyltransferase
MCPSIKSSSGGRQEIAYSFYKFLQVPTSSYSLDQEKLMSEISYGRQTDIVDPVMAKALHVTICGLGTVGSHAAVELARMGVGSLHLIDGDEVEAHNLPSQAYEVADIGRTKAEACADRVRAVSDHIEVRAEHIMLDGGEVFDDGPVILAVDNMDARKNILDLSVAYHPNHPLVIDGRMAGKMLQLLAFDPSNDVALGRWVNEYWFPQEEAHPIPCGGRSVSFIGAYVGALITSYICRSLAEQSVPFFLMTDLDSFHVTRIKDA